MDALSEMRVVLEDARHHSHGILAAHGHELPRLLQEKQIWATIDRAHARSFLTHAAPSSLRAQHQMVVLNDVIQILSVIAAMVLGVIVFEWWGLLLLVLVPLYLLASWRSAQLPRLRGRLPKFGGIAFIVATIYFIVGMQPWQVAALTMVLALLSFYSVIRYSYPTGVMRRVLVQQPQLANDLVDGGVVTLHRASELPEVRNRGF